MSRVHDFKATRLLAYLAGLALTSMAPAQELDTATVEASRAAIAAAIASPDRPASDRQQDERRKPQQVLEFAAAGPRMHVVDVFSAGVMASSLFALRHTNSVFGSIMRQSLNSSATLHVGALVAVLPRVLAKMAGSARLL